jgi:hypothetical protein
MNIDTFNKFLKDRCIIYNLEELYYLVMNLLSSKELCHYIINNKYMLELLLEKKFYSKYYYVFKYLLSYAWLTFYLEESIKKKHIVSNDRFIYDIDTAYLLPYMPCNYTELIEESPYLPILINQELYNKNNNIMGVLPIYSSDIRYGICDIDTFIFRFNLFCSGTTINIFKDLDFNNIAMTGSVMACCLPNFNPLFLNLIRFDDINTSLFVKYIKEYYRDADLDVMCNLDGLEFIDKVYSIKECIEMNLNKKINITPIKTATAFINEDFINKYLKEILEVQEKNFNSSDIKNIIYPMYCNYKKEKDINLNIIDNKYLDEINIVSINDMQVIYIKNNENIISFSENLKYKLSSDLLPRTIEIFKIKYDDFFSTVSTFHLPIVRAFYNGITVKMTPSCISACFTMINIDYKYFAGSKDPIEIINKYRCRGFGTILNDKEKMRFIQYNKLNSKWNHIYNLHSQQNISKSFGFKSLNDIIFQYSTYVYHEFTYYLNNDNIIKTTFQLDYYKTLYNFKTDFQEFYKKFKCINKYGYVEPMKHYIIDFGYNNPLEILN